MKDEYTVRKTWNQIRSKYIDASHKHDARHGEETSLPCREQVVRPILQVDDLKQSPSEKYTDRITRLPGHCRDPASCIAQPLLPGWVRKLGDPVVLAARRRCHAGHLGHAKIDRTEPDKIPQD